ncbi:MAG: ATP synthase F1 subunit gamma [Rickettsiales bacterium]|nr:MAG: ATP synthase F1 subunit gamma [Rickettsiales bacterium]
MSNLKQLRNRVKTIKSTQKITKAMHVVSAAKLNKIKDQAFNLNNFSQALAEVMYDISNSGNLMDLPSDDRKFFNDDMEKLPHLLVVITSERGLCGSFNSNIIKRAKAEIKSFQKLGKSFKLLIIGKKGRDALRIDYADKIIGYYHVSHGNYECVSREVKDKIIALVQQEEVGACDIFYNKFINAMTQLVSVEQMLPAQNQETDSSSQLDSNKVTHYEYEGEGLVHDVIDLYIHGEINYALLQSRASEEGARMTAMDNSTKNAKELINKFTLKLNRSRQAIITTELTEIISGAEAI